NYQGSFRTALDSATTVPQVVRISPSNHSAVLLNPVIELEYNEPLDPSTINSTTVSLRQNIGGQPLIPSTITLGRGGRVIRIVPDAPLAPNSNYFYQVSNTIRDLDGMSPGFFFTNFFTTTNVSDNTAPQVLAVSPFDGATGVGLNAQFHLRFDEPINPLSVTGATVLVSAGNNVAMPSTISFSNSDREVLIVPHSPLPEATLMTIKVEGVEDLAGNAVVVHTTQFTTAAAPDVSAPQILRTNPFNGATDVPVNTVITLESNEALDPVTINSNTFIVRDNVTGTNLSGTISLSMNGRTLTFAPNTPLAVGRNHSVFFAFQGIQDLAGNFLSGSNFSFTTSFAADVIGPQVTGVSPADGLTQAPINAQVMVTFNEPVQTLSVDNVTLTAAATPINVTRTLTNGNRTLTLTPALLLPANTLFTVNIGTAVKDLAGNNLSSAVTTSFTTGTGADLIRPTITQVDPASGATGVPTNAVIRLQFSERINPLTVNSSTFQILTSNFGVPVSGNITVAADRLSATFTPSSPLALSTAYFIQAFGITDLTGQEINFFFTSFTTALGSDNTGPTVVAINPPDGTIAVPVNARVVAKLSEPVNPLSVSNTAITLTQNGAPVVGTTVLSSDRLFLFFTPATALATSTTFNLNVSGFSDSAGNQAVPFNSSFTTAAAGTADNSSPFVTTVMPANGTTAVPVNTSIVFTFNENIDPTSISSNNLNVGVQQTGAQVAGSITINGAMVTFTPANPLPANTRIFVQIFSVADLAGNNSNFFFSTFDTGAAADVTAPQVQMVTPTDGATDIGPNAVVVLTFSESLHPNTINNNNFGLFAGSNRLSVGVNRTADNRTVTLSTTLPFATVISVVVTADVQDLSGNHLADFRSQFTTAAQPDTDRPS